MGLAWTSHGGSALYVECVDCLNPDSVSKDEAPPAKQLDSVVVTENVSPEGTKTGGKKKSGATSLNVTGQLGDCMKESSSVAWTYARRYLKNVDPDNELLRSRQVLLIPHTGKNRSKFHTNVKFCCFFPYEIQNLLFVVNE